MQQVSTSGSILKFSFMVFNPLKLISPIILPIKYLFKEACALKGTWDDIVHDEFMTKWNKFFNELENLNPIKVGWYLFTNQNYVIVFELQGF